MSMFIYNFTLWVPQRLCKNFHSERTDKKNLHIHDLCVPKPSLFITCIYFLVYFRYIFMLVCYNFFWDVLSFSLINILLKLFTRLIFIVSVRFWLWLLWFYIKPETYIKKTNRQRIKSTLISVFSAKRERNNIWPLQNVGYWPLLREQKQTQHRFIVLQKHLGHWIVIPRI